VSIKDDKKQLSEFQKSLKYKLVKIGDIVEEVHWVSAEPDGLLTGVVVDIERGAINQLQWFNFTDDRITIKWFKTGEIEKLPSAYIKIISNIPDR
tara:strand:- start:273 stop:557 length:285 start_codon:yes stop_codon:yes gene_type:complete